VPTNPPVPVNDLIGIAGVSSGNVHALLRAIIRPDSGW